MDMRTDIVRLRITTIPNGQITNLEKCKNPTIREARDFITSMRSGFANPHQRTRATINRCRVRPEITQSIVFDPVEQGSQVFPGLLDIELQGISRR